jgi:hypothetical protein
MGEDCGLRPAWPNSKTPSQLGMMVHVCNLRFRDAVNGLQSKASPRQKCETLSKKLIKPKMAGGVAQEVVHLPSKLRP